MQHWPWTNKKPLNSSERYEANATALESRTMNFLLHTGFRELSENSATTDTQMLLILWWMQQRHSKCHNMNDRSHAFSQMDESHLKRTKILEKLTYPSNATTWTTQTTQRILLQNCSCYNANSGWLMNDLARRILQQNCSCYKQIWMKDSVYVSRHKRKTSTRLSRRITQHNRWLWNIIMLYLIENYSMETRTSTKRNVLFCSPLASVQRRNNFDGYWRCWISVFSPSTPSTSF